MPPPLQYHQCDFSATRTRGHPIASSFPRKRGAGGGGEGAAGGKPKSVSTGGHPCGVAIKDQKLTGSRILKSNGPADLCSGRGDRRSGTAVMLQIVRSQPALACSLRSLPSPLPSLFSLFFPRHEHCAVASPAGARRCVVVARVRRHGGAAARRPLPQHRPRGAMDRLHTHQGQQGLPSSHRTPTFPPAGQRDRRRRTIA